jgi:hypothetical protein
MAAQAVTPMGLMHRLPALQSILSIPSPSSHFPNPLCVLCAFVVKTKSYG